MIYFSRTAHRRSRMWARPHAGSGRRRTLTRQATPLQKPRPAKVNPFGMLFATTTKGNSEGTPQTRTTAHHNIHDETSTFGQEMSRQEEVEKLEFGAWPLCSIFRTWNMNCRSEVARGSNRPTQAMPWTNEVEKAKDLNDMATSNLIRGIASGDFERMCSKKASVQ